MKNTIITLASVAALAGAANAQVAFTGNGTDNMTGTGSWLGGSLTYTLTDPVAGNPGVNLGNKIGGGDLNIWGGDNDGGIPNQIGWRSDDVSSTTTNGSSMTFNSANFFVGQTITLFDLDGPTTNKVRITASLGGLAVDTSNWFQGGVASRASGSLSNNATWEAATSTLTAGGFNANFWVDTFTADTAFDSVTLTHTGRDNDWTAVGFTAPVPEPSSTALLGLGALGLLARRKRS